MGSREGALREGRSMKILKALRGILISLLVASLVAAPLILAPPAYAAEADEVGTEAEFIQWVTDHRGTGGSVKFTSDITITETYLEYPGIDIYCYGEGERILIDTASYGLTIKVDLFLGEDVSITGNGAPEPVLHISNSGSLTMLGNVSSDRAPTVTATGDGGVAVYCDQGAYFFGYVVFALRAEGANGIALFTEGDPTPDDPYYGNGYTGGIFEATGSGGRGIVSDAPVTLFLCSVLADRAAVEAPFVLLDTCGDIYPDVPGATTIRRTLNTVASWGNEASAVALGDYDTLEWLGISYGVAATFTAEGFDVRHAGFEMRFDISLVDVETLGCYPMPGFVPSPYDLALHGFASFEVEVFDASVPLFKHAFFNMMRGGYVFEYFYTGAACDLVLWRSDDMGETWFQYWRGADDFTMSDNLWVWAFAPNLTLVVVDPLDELSGEILLVFEVLSLGVDSKTVYANLSEDDVSEYGGGGDRTGTDRGPGIYDGGRNDGDGEAAGNTTPPGGGPLQAGGSSNGGTLQVGGGALQYGAMQAAQGDGANGVDNRPTGSNPAPLSSNTPSSDLPVAEVPLAGETSSPLAPALEPLQSPVLWIVAAILIAALSLAGYRLVRTHLRGAAS